MSEHAPETPDEILTAYENAAAALPQPWRWWFLRKARKRRQQWDARLETELIRSLSEVNQ